MKVLLVSFYYHPELGAAPSRITNMANGLKREGVDVDVLTCLPNYPKGKIFEGYRGRISKKEVIDGINVYRYWTYASVSKNVILRAFGMLSFALVMWLFAFKRKLICSYDKVIVQSPPLFVPLSAIILFKSLYNRKVILNISDLWPLSAVELGAMSEGGKMHKIFSWIERFIYRKSDAILGQSNEILRHINEFESPKYKFLYRNLQKYDVNVEFHKKGEVVKIVYAGLLGVAQDILGIIKNIDFKGLGVEFHLYGGGNQTNSIVEYINNNSCNVFYHGYVDKSQMANELAKYDVSIVPLVVRIKGAVPSKIFDIIPMGMPVLFCGGGEGAEIVKEYNLGYVSEPQDYKALSENIARLKSLSDEEYILLSKNCVKASKSDFDFDVQMKKTFDFISSI
ncbi:MAG: glycosyltransferase family 4 protein [Paludibacteraceae bacterium]|nr:glycosyltransferase family 4 protein [Paludibacteraceae bacterium]